LLPKIGKFQEAPRVEVKRSRHGVGFLLVYGAMVFADTLGSVDEVNSPRFFIVFLFIFRTT